MIYCVWCLLEIWIQQYLPFFSASLRPQSVSNKVLVGSSNNAWNHLKDSAICPIISDNSLKQTIQQSRPLHVGLACESRQNLNFSEGVSKLIVFFTLIRIIGWVAKQKKNKSHERTFTQVHWFDVGRDWDRKYILCWWFRPWFIHATGDV